MKKRFLLPSLTALVALSSGCLSSPKLSVEHTSFSAKIRIYRILAARDSGLAAPGAIAPTGIESRIQSFVEAIGDREEADVNRVLGDGARVLRLVHEKRSVSEEDATSLFVAAVYMGFDDVVDIALKRGADINKASPLDTLKRPAVLVALQYGTRCKDASWLKDARLDVRDAKGRGVVHYAVKAGDAESLAVLLASKCDATTPDGDGVTPLALAADLGYLEFVKALYPVSDAKIADKDHMTPLLRAAEHGRLDVVKYLFEQDASLLNMVAVDDVGEFGVVELASRAAAQAADRNASKLLEWVLRDRKIKPTPRSVTERVRAGDVATLKMLVAWGGVLRNSDRRYDGVRVPGHLTLAVRNNDLPMVRYLVSRGLDVNDSSVVDAVSDADGEVVDFLRENGLREPAIRP